MSRPLVTVGLTTFNAADSVERAVRSALAQTWRPIEIVAVDDCSSDATRGTLERLAARTPELRIFVNPANSGVATSRNRIIEEARGDFIAFFDDDDESLPHRIEAQVRRITQYEESFAGGAPVVCHTARRRIYTASLERIEGTMGQVEGKPAPAGPAVARRILLGEPLANAYGACPTCCQMARRSTFQLVNGFDPSLRRGEDTDFSIRLAEAGGHFVGLAEPLVVQWMTKTMEKTLAEEHRNTMVLIEKHRAIIDGAGQYDFCCRWADLKHVWRQGASLQFASGLAVLACRHPLLTAKRILLAMPNAGLNRAFRLFHRTSPENGQRF